MPETEGVLLALARDPYAPRGRAPIWRQIADRVQFACDSGALAGAQRLPGENRMAEIFGVTRVTIRRALASLQQEGQLQARKGVGVFVRPSPLRYRLDHGARFADGLNLPADAIGAETLSLLRGRAGPDEAEALALHQGDAVIRLRRLRTVDAAPVYVTAKTFPAALFDAFETVYAARGSVRDVFAAHGVPGYRRAQTRVSGGFATAEEAAALRLTPRTPVLRTVALNVAPDGRPIEFNIGAWPLTAVEMVLTPQRDDDGEAPA